MKGQKGEKSNRNVNRWMVRRLKNRISLIRSTLMLMMKRDENAYRFDLQKHISRSAPSIHMHEYMKMII